MLASLRARWPEAFAAPVSLATGIIQEFREGPGVVGVNEVLTMHFGPVDVLAVLSLDFENALTANDVETVVSGIERRIKQEYPVVRRIFVEAQSREEHLRAQKEFAPRET